MKITPLEIRQKEFEKKLRGYDKDDVNAFLLSLSNEWERVIEENKELTLKLRQAEKEVEKLREVESSLYKTLKTAEETGANVIDQANKAAELHMKETQMNAEALLSESKNKARGMIEKAEEEARLIIDELQDAVKNIEQNHREIAIHELKNLSVTLIEKVERTTRGSKEIKFDDYVKRVKDLARESEERIKAEKVTLQPSIERVEKALEASEKENIEPIKTTSEAEEPVRSEKEPENMQEEVSNPNPVDASVPVSEPEPVPEQEEPVVAKEAPKPEKTPKPAPQSPSSVSFFDEFDDLD